MTQISRLDVSPYLLPLKHGWSTSRGVVRERQGFLIRAVVNGELVGVGDCAPLPAAGTESLSEAEARLALACRALPDRTTEEVLEIIHEWKDTPATRFALETAILDLLAQSDVTPLSRWLASDAASRVRVNAAVGALDAGVLDRCRYAIEEGYDVLKIKVGVKKIYLEIKRIKHIIDNVDKVVSLRLDANGAWSQRSAIAFIRALHGLPIESLEEPLKDPDPVRLGQLQDIAPWPIAIDESVSRWLSAGSGDDPPVRRVICKPTVLGQLRETLALGKRLQGQGIEVVITTTLESATGTWACVHLAAALNNDLAHGLATSEWFAANIGIAPQARAGGINIPSTPGLGLGLRDP